MEASSAHVPLVAVASQIPRDLIGRGRGYLHELRDQRASFEPIVKWSARARSAADVPELLAEAWQRAQTPPSGRCSWRSRWTSSRARPIYESTGSTEARPRRSCRTRLDSTRRRACSRAPRTSGLGGERRLRSGAWEELRAVAETLRAVVVTSYMGKGAFPEDHELSAGSACDEAAFRELVEGADAVLVVGSELGAETTQQYALQFGGQLVQIDANEERIRRHLPRLRSRRRAGRRGTSSYTRSWT